MRGRQGVDRASHGFLIGRRDEGGQGDDNDGVLGRLVRLGQRHALRHVERHGRRFLAGRGFRFRLRFRLYRRAGFCFCNRFCVCAGFCFHDGFYLRGGCCLHDGFCFRGGFCCHDGFCFHGSRRCIVIGIHNHDRQRVMAAFHDQDRGCAIAAFRKHDRRAGRGRSRAAIRFRDLDPPRAAAGAPGGACLCAAADFHDHGRLHAATGIHHHGRFLPAAGIHDHGRPSAIAGPRRCDRFLAGLVVRGACGGLRRVVDGLRGQYVDPGAGQSRGRIPRIVRDRLWRQGSGWRVLLRDVTKHGNPHPGPEESLRFSVVIQAGFRAMVIRRVGGIGIGRIDLAR